MRTIRTKVYKFDELTPEAQWKAIENLADINVMHEWWEFIYEDAKQIGLIINSFDEHSCTGKLEVSLMECCDLIHKNHGEQCATYKTATDFELKWNELVTKYSDGITTDKVSEENESDFDNQADELETEFKHSLLEDYRILLNREYEYLTSREAIEESIRANEYEFLPNGKLI